MDTLPIPEVLLDSDLALMTRRGEFRVRGYSLPESGAMTEPIVVLSTGTPERAENPLVRIHSKCATSEVFGSLMCDCAQQLDYAMDRIQDEGCGLIIYLHQEARGNGLLAKFRIYQVMQDQRVTSAVACTTLGYPVDARSYEQAAAILSSLQIHRCRLLTNNTDKVAALVQYGFDVQRERVPVEPNPHNLAYLLDKQRRHHHDLGLPDPEGSDE